MNKKKMIEKLEQSLSHFMIEEATKNNPMLKGRPEMYKYKGLSLTIDTQNKEKEEKTIAVRIGSLEAEFKIDSCDKASGALNPEDEKMVMLWMARNENSYSIKTLFLKKNTVANVSIIPFDLEEFYIKKT